MDWPDFRQLQHAPQFRIRKPVRFLEQVEDLFSSIAAGGTTEAQRLEAGASVEELVLQIGNAIWRLEQRIVDRNTGTTREEYRKLTRHLESISNALRTFDVQIQNHTDQPFVTGLALDVVAFEPCESIQQEIVIETVAPSIYIGNKKLQTGKVIVGTPAA